MTAINTPPDIVLSPPRASFKLSWSAVLAGLVVTLGTWILLTVLGLAAGLSSIDPQNPESATHAGIGTGIWSLVVPLVALFIGGMVTARTAGIVDRGSGAIHGAILWAVATIASIVLIGAMVRTVVTTALGVTSDAVGAVGSAAGSAAMSTGDVGRALGIRTDDLVGPLNDRLRSEGKPTVTAAQLEAATKDAARDIVREGRIDREMLVRSIADKTALSNEDARSVAADVEARFTEARGNAGERVDAIGRDMQAGALRAADSTGKALWWVFLAMVLGLGASVVGSTIGVSRRQRDAAAGDRLVPLVPREA